MPHELCKTCSDNMPYAVLRRRRSLLWEMKLANILGKDAAYLEKAKLSRDEPDFEYRVMQHNAAQATLNGQKLGLFSTRGCTTPYEMEEMEKEDYARERRMLRTASAHGEEV